jgi:hypothetical protein
MKSVHRFPQCALATVIAVLSVSAGLAQTGPAVVRDIEVVPGKKGLSIQIVSSRPVLPEVTRVEGPTRIVIDIPAAVLAAPKRIAVNGYSVREVRASQFQNRPPVTRVVVELTAVRDYSVVTSGNKLAVWLRAPEAEEPSAGSRAPIDVPQPPNVTQPAALPRDASNVQAADIRTISGPSSISAVKNTAIVRLPRGGEVHVCPGTNVSVTPSQNGRDLMVGLSTGTIETHYNLGSSADLILTPDFRILLPGPGTFHFAVSADRQGNTCVRALEGNTASVVLSEMMGDASYQVHANEQAWFRSGRLHNVSSVVPPTCGCPVEMVPIMRAEETPPPAPEAPLQEQRRPTAQVDSRGTGPAVTNPLPTAKRNEARVQVDAPFVFRADPARVPPTPAVAQLRLLPRSSSELLDLTPQAPASVTYYRLQSAKIDKGGRRGFFGKLGGVLAGIFR